MGKDKKLEIELNHIIYDYKAILQYLKTCMENKLDYASYMGIMPYFCMYVLEGYKFLAEKDIINKDCIKKSDIKHIEKCRAGGVKLYSEFNQKSFNSINNFNRDEYLKFFKKTFPNSKPQILSFIDNYFICCIDNQPIGNYHLYSKKFISMEIGSYIYDIKQKVYDFARVLSSFISQILVGIDKRLMNCNIEKPLDVCVKYFDLNMAYGYKNFRIKDNPPILMALLDVLCVLNSYINVFNFINKDALLDLKVKYSILFYSILSIKDIFTYCDNNAYSQLVDKELFEYVLLLENHYLSNKLRKYCMHYNFPDDLFKKDPFTEAFEEKFAKNIEEITTEISSVIKVLSDKMKKYLIILDFKEKDD